MEEGRVRTYGQVGDMHAAVCVPLVVAEASLWRMRLIRRKAARDADKKSIRMPLNKH